MIDMVIVGGGLVGLSAALACAKSGFQVAVIMDKEPVAVKENQISPMVCAINHASANLLRRLGVWERCRPHAFAKMSLTAQPNHQAFSFDSGTVAEDNLGYIVANERLSWLLFLEAQAHPNVTFFKQALARSMTYEGGLWVIETNKGDELRAPVVIGADGRQSWVAKQQSWVSESIDYGHTAWVGLVSSQISSQHAYQHFSEKGPIGLLPLGDGKTWAMIMSFDNDIKPEDVSIDEILNQAFGYALGDMQSEAVSRFPLKGHHASFYAKKGVYLVGDALHTIHPLAGQGVNLGLLDVAALVDIFSTLADWQGSGAVAKYHYWRRGHNELMYKAIAGLKCFFQASDPMSRAFRSIGLMAFDNSRWLKSKAILMALGCSGRIAPWAKQN